MFWIGTFSLSDPRKPIVGRPPFRMIAEKILNCARLDQHGTLLDPNLNAATVN